MASLVAQHFHQQGMPVNLFNSRSFSSITKFLVGHIRLIDKTGEKESLGRILLGWLAYPIIKFSLALVKWEMDAGSAFRSIPEKYRDYIVVRSPKSERETRVDDNVIPYYASIHKELTPERSKQKLDKEKAIQELKVLNSVESPRPIENCAKRSLREAKEKIHSGRKMQPTDPDETNGHNIELASLNNKSGKSGLEFFRMFVEQTHKDHGVSNIANVNTNPY